MKIPNMRMPTYEEHREVSLGWLDYIQPTLIDQWPKEVLKLSMPTIFVPIDAEDFLKAMDSAENYNNPGKVPYFCDLAARLDDILGWEKMFFRLNSRSSKDVGPSITMSGKEVVDNLLCSMRVLEDLVHFKYVPEQKCFICLRKYVPIYNGLEFRCFVKNRNLIGISAYYDSRNDYDYVTLNTAEKSIVKFYEEKLEPVMDHVDDIVFDVHLSGNLTEVQLIELNPYWLSDPCLFESYAEIESNPSTVIRDS